MPGGLLSEIAPSNLDENSRKEAILVNIQSPLNIEYWVFLDAPYPFEVTHLRAQLSTGSLNISLCRKRGATETILADFEDQPIQTSLAVLTASSDNTFEIGDQFYIRIGNVTDATRLRVQIDFTRGVDVE